MGQGERLAEEELSLTLRAKAAVERAADEARRLGHEQIRSEHLLLGVLGDDGWMVFRLLKELGTSRSALRAAVERQLRPAEGEQPA